MSIYIPAEYTTMNSVLGKKFQALVIEAGISDELAQQFINLHVQVVEELKLALVSKP